MDVVLCSSPLRVLHANTKLGVMTSTRLVWLTIYGLQSGDVGIPRRALIWNTLFRATFSFLLFF